MKRRRVLHIGKYYHPFKGGVERAVQTLAEGASREWDVEVVVANAGSQTKIDDVSGVRVTRLGRKGDLFGAPFCPGLWRYLRKSVFDIIHVHLPNPFAEIGYLLAQPKGKLVVSYHSDIVRQRRLLWFYQPVQKAILRRADRIIATAQNNIEYSTVLREYREKCTVVPLSVNPDDFVCRDGDAAAVIRRRFGPRIVLAVGRLIYYKGFECAIRAMRDVPEAHLVIIGDGPLKGELESIARESGVEDRVTLLDGVQDVVSYYHACDVFVLPSVAPSEAFGIVQLEAMAAGKPVVNTALASGVTEVSVDGETGFTVPPSDPVPLARAIRCLLDDPDLRRRMGEAGVCRVRERFSNSVEMAAISRIYAEVCGI